ncbi:MAG: hypothetical protein R2932_19205 [Caldilineaceae bacterium]
MQKPPIYSALKQGGESLHRKARRGEDVTVLPRPVTIYQIDLVDFTSPARIALRVVCSAGTYIRSLAHDLGQALGTCAHLSRLRREWVGQFALTSSMTLATIEATATAGQLVSVLQPSGVGLDMPEVPLLDEFAHRLGHGQKVYLSAQTTPALGSIAAPYLLAKAVDFTGNFLGVIRCIEQSAYSQDRSLWKAEKWLATNE